MNKVTVLGSGTSTGVPIIRCRCRVCTSQNPKNKRFRSSLYLKTAKGRALIVDTTPDFRSQCLQHNIRALDAVILTHEHTDHIGGLDDLRPFCFGPPPKTIPIYTAAHTLKVLKNRFSYAFKDQSQLVSSAPKLKLHPVHLRKATLIEKESFQFFLLPHGHTRTLAFVHQKLGYIIDCEKVTPSVLKYFQKADLDLLIIDCAKRNHHRTHLTYPAVVDYIRAIKPKRCGLIHLGHDFEHESFQQELKSIKDQMIFPLYDGQKLSYRS